MNDVPGSQVLTPLSQLIDNTPPLQVLVFRSIFFKISTFTILSDDIAMIAGVEDIHQFKYVGMV